MDKKIEVYPGLDKIYVAETEISNVDGEQGDLIYAGYRIEKLIAEGHSFESIIFLFLHNKLPTEEERRNFTENLATRRTLSPQFMQFIDATATLNLDYMTGIRTVISALSHDMTSAYPPTPDQILNLVAKLPLVISRYHRSRTGQPYLEPKPELSHVANYYYQITGKLPDEQNNLYIRALEIYFICAMEHGLNASAFSVRVTNSAQPDFITSITSGFCTLKGRLHGGAMEEITEMFDAIGPLENARPWLKKRLAAGQVIMGRGHRVYTSKTKGDPRVSHLKNAVEALPQEDNPQLKYALELDKIITEVLIEHHHEKQKKKPEAERDPIASPPCTNVDYFGASLLNAIFDRSLHTATFGAARSVGYGLHALESSKKPRLVRPLGLYVGPDPDLVLTDSEKSTPVKNSLDFTVWQKEPNVVTTFAPTMSMSMNPKDE